MTSPVLLPYQRFPRSAYGPIAPRAQALLPRTAPDRRGWGPGWPDAQKSRVVPVTVVGVRVRVFVEVADYFGYLLWATEQLGYDVRLHPDQAGYVEGTPTACGGTWGFANRAIKGSSPPAPSWHSWGLALDLNAPCNPMSFTWRSNILPLVVELWESAGCYWGGRYKKPWKFDPMHFEYLGRPADVAGDLRRAERALARLLGTNPPPPPPLPPEDDMPLVTTYLPGYTAVVADPTSFATVRDAPSPKAKVVREAHQPERWQVVGWVTGEHSAFGNSDQWLLRVGDGGKWEYTAKGNVVEGPLPPEAVDPELRARVLALEGVAAADAADGRTAADAVGRIVARHEGTQQ